ncbi:penicillin acylase family protein [Pikeienuella piscinae]|uniref:Penicillin acylase family protein n=1 Tax=Pikeienuella piscinae TaxID=2748098 RepID=A0A7L5BU92_9RHOB|nr:penicillin acylase family protein [Pikeienuella piscinae]QIE55335.1 penicillin acylase family protein [Pikeienuella piscinae]
MRTLFRVLLWLTGGLLALALIAAGLGYYLISRSKPDYDSVQTLAGLNGEVEIVRDANAVPHIYAQTDADAYFALGVVHAQERLWQMELSRRGAQGRLSELFGPAALSLDRRLRALDLHALARASLRYQSAETIEALDAYSAGVNAWIGVVNESALGRGAPEFFLFNEGLAPWTPADSIAILKVMALRLTNAATMETKRAKLLRRLTPEQLEDLFPVYPDPGILSLPTFAKGHPEPGAPTVTRRASRDEDDALGELEELFFPPARRAGASNVWAVDGDRTATGASLLANDPHLWLSAPSVWMLVHVEFPGEGVIGGSLAGVPAVLVGRNRSLAWGLTTAGIDDQDVYIEKLNPENPDEYLTPEGWARMTSRTETIRVKGADDVATTLRWTRHGPVPPPDLYDLGAVTPEGHVAALAWTALSAEDRSLEAALNLMRATTIEAAVKAGEKVLAPGQNVAVAEKSGVGVFVTGRPPNRRIGSRSHGRLPSLGWIAENDWDGLADPSATPRSIRPASGVVANANNRTTNAPFPDHLSFDWEAPYRIRRIEQKLNARQFHTAESFVELQNDTVSEMARAVLPLIASDLWWTRDEGVGDARGDRRDAALKMLGAWNGEMSEHAAEPLIFAAWMRALTRRIAGDELGEDLSEIEGARPLFIERVFYDVDGAGRWCDVDKTARVETCAEISKLALDDALDELVAAHGADMSTWRWGEVHRARHLATPLGLRWPFDLFVNIEHETSGGDYTVQRAQTRGRGPEPYLNVHAAGYRAVYDFADLDRSVYIISTGESGHLLSRHYDDLAELWRAGEYIPMSMADSDIRAGALGVMRLLPAEE